MSLSERRVFELLDEGAIQSVTIGGARRLVKNSVYELIVTRLIASNPDGGKPLPKIPAADRRRKATPRALSHKSRDAAA